MSRQAVDRLLNEVGETQEFFRAGIVAIDITEADPFTGDRTGHEDEIFGTKEETDEYAYWILLLRRGKRDQRRRPLLHVDVTTGLLSGVGDRGRKTPEEPDRADASRQ